MVRGAVTVFIHSYSLNFNNIIYLCIMTYVISGVVKKVYWP